MNIQDKEQPNLWILEIHSTDDKTAALSACSSALELHPDSSDLWNAYGDVLAQHEMQEQSLSAFRRAVSLSPENPIFWNNLGVSLRKSDLLDEAGAAFVKAINLDPSFPNPQYNLRDVQLTRKRKSSPALLTDRSAVRQSKAKANEEKTPSIKQSNDPSIWLSVADELLQKNLLERALKILKKAIQVHPASCEIWLKYAEALDRAGQTKRVDSVLKNMVKLHPENVDALNWIGVRHLAKGDIEQAIVALQKAVDVEPANQHCRLLALLLDGQGRTDEAVDVLDKAVSRSEAPACRWNLLGVLLHKLALHQKALSAFKRGIETDPQSSYIYNNLGRLLEDMGNDTAATQSFKTAIELDKGNAVAWNNLGRILRKSGAIARAEKAFRIAISIAPHYRNPWLNLRDLSISSEAIDDSPVTDHQLPEPLASKWSSSGWTVFDEDHLSKQLVSLTHEVDTAPDDPDKLHSLALCLSNARRFRDSLELLQRAVALNPNSAILWNMLGMVSESLGKTDDAICHYRRALECDSTYVCAMFNLFDIKQKQQSPERSS